VILAADRFQARREDWARHVADLQMGTYDGASSRAECEAVFQRAFELTTPVALDVLESLAVAYLGGEAVTSVTLPQPVPDEALLGASRTPVGGLLGSWNLTWPALERARDRLTGEPFPPVQIFAMYPSDFTHGHLALFDLGAPRTSVANWPFQVTTAADAERQERILSAIAEADLHERTFASDLNWRLLEID
jgi:hypothetical protein